MRLGLYYAQALLHLAYFLFRRTLLRIYDAVEDSIALQDAIRKLNSSRQVVYHAIG